MQRMLTGLYRPVVQFFVCRRWAAVVVAVFLLAVGGFIAPRLGSEFTPRLQEGTITVESEADVRMRIQHVQGIG